MNSDMRSLKANEIPDALCGDHPTIRSLQTAKAAE